MTDRPRTVAVLGIGSPVRGDDGVGRAVAARVAALGLPNVRVEVGAQPLDLLEDGVTEDLVVVVDAVRSGAAPGTLLVRRVGREALPEWAGAASTHALGLDAVVELARALGRMPRELVLVGVEAAGFETGAPLTAAVHDAVRVAADAVARLAGAAPAGPDVV
jgi:hydrogenase maturation protease